MNELSTMGYLQRNSHALAVTLRLGDAVCILILLYLSILYFDVPQAATIGLYISGLESIIFFHIYSSLLRMYRSWRGSPFKMLVIAVSKAWAFTFITVIIINNGMTGVELLYQPMLTWFASVLAVMIVGRLIVRIVLHEIRTHGMNSRVVAIVGGGKTGVRMAQMITSKPELGLLLKGIYDDRCPHSERMTWQGEITGGYSSLLKAANDKQIDIVYITLPLSAEGRIAWLVDALSDSTVSVNIVPDLFLQTLFDADWSSFQGVPVISVCDAPFHGVIAWVKRIQDIILSLTILWLILGPMLIISLAIKISSPGPVLFKQRRYGMDGKEIRVWKFRTMRTLDDGEHITQAGKNDDRVTRLGRFLRRTSLDELPQFINVLMGEMSIVGPRPHAVAHNEAYRTQIKRYMLRHSVKPGITGWAQINGWRGETETLDKMEKRIEYDLWYIRHWSFWLDVKIVLLTVFKGFFSDKAY